MKPCILVDEYQRSAGIAASIFRVKFLDYYLQDTMLQLFDQQFETSLFYKLLATDFFQILAHPVFKM